MSTAPRTGDGGPGAYVSVSRPKGDPMTDASPRADADAPPPRLDPLEAARERLLDALPDHVAFDGWSRTAIEAAARDGGVEPELARLIFPRGGIDAALAFHARGDRQMAEAFAAEVRIGMGFTAKVTRAVRLRLELVEPAREAVRRAVSMFALPTYAPEGAAALWRTADAIWTAVGDSSEDVNWYTKRATLSGVYSATVLYWLADESDGREATWAFLDRRIADVIRIEKAKAEIRRNPLGRLVMQGADRMGAMIRAPHARGDAAPGD